MPEPIRMFDIAYVYEQLGKKKKPSARVEAAIAKCEGHLCRYVESMLLTSEIDAMISDRLKTSK